MKEISIIGPSETVYMVALARNRCKCGHPKDEPYRWEVEKAKIIGMTQKHYVMYPLDIPKYQFTELFYNVEPISPKKNKKYEGESISGISVSRYRVFTSKKEAQNKCIEWNREREEK